MESHEARERGLIRKALSLGRKGSEWGWGEKERGEWGSGGYVPQRAPPSSEAVREGECHPSRSEGAQKLR